MVPKDPDGNNYAFGVYQSAYNNLMHTMASGDLDGDGSDAIIFSDHYRNVSEVHIDII